MQQITYAIIVTLIYVIFAFDHTFTLEQPNHYETVTSYEDYETDQYM